MAGEAPRTASVEGCRALLHEAGWSVGAARFGSVWQVDAARGGERIIGDGETELEAWREVCAAATEPDAPTIQPVPRKA